MAHLKFEIPLIQAIAPDLKWIDYYESAIDDIIELGDEYKFLVPNHPAIEVKISRQSNTHVYNGRHRKNVSTLLIFEMVIPDEPVFFKEYLRSKEKPEYVLMHYQAELILEIKVQIFHLLIFSNLAKPGAIKAKEGKIFMDGQKCDTSRAAISIHRESFEELEKLNWIQYKSLKIGDVITWFKRNEYSFDRFSKSSTERALNAFTLLFSENMSDLASDLFWSLIGVEALFCSGKEGISQQLFEKTQVVFGELKSFKKRVKEMYNFRSSLIHGSLNFAPQYFYEENEERWHYDDKLYESMILASAILTGAIQELIITDKSEFNFQYRLI